MSELLAQVQQLLAGAASQPLTATQLSQILSVLAAGSSADPIPSPAMPPIISSTLVITPPSTITFSSVFMVSCHIPFSPSVQETPIVPVEDVSAVFVSDTPVQPLMSPLVYSPTSGEFSFHVFSSTSYLYSRFSIIC